MPEGRLRRTREQYLPSEPWAERWVRVADLRAMLPKYEIVTRADGHTEAQRLPTQFLPVDASE